MPPLELSVPADYPAQSPLWIDRQWQYGECAQRTAAGKPLGCSWGHRAGGGQLWATRVFCMYTTPPAWPFPLFLWLPLCGQE